METLPSPEGSIMDLYYISTFIIEAFWSGWWQGQLVTSQYLAQIQSISGVHMVPTLHRMLFYSWETLVSTDLKGNFTKSNSKAGEDFGHGTIGFCGAIPISMAKPQSLWINVGCFSCFPPLFLFDSRLTKSYSIWANVRNAHIIRPFEQCSNPPVVPLYCLVNRDSQFMDYDNSQYW